MKIKLSLSLLITSLGTVAIAMALITHAILYVAARTSASEINNQNARMAADTTARNVSNFVNLLSLSLAGQANDAKLARVVAQGDPVLILPEEERITQAIPSAWLVRLLPEELDVPDESRPPKMGFADLNLVRAAVSESVKPTINLAGSADAHLAIAKRLANGGGVLLGSWPLKVLDGALAEQGACGIELRQENVAFAYRGIPACKEGEPLGELFIKGTPWKIAYWSQPDYFPLTPWFAGALGASLVLLAGLTFALASMLRTNFRNDQKSLLGLAGELMGGNYPPSEHRFKLTEFASLADEISRLRRMVREAPAADYADLQKVAALQIVEAQPAEYPDYPDLASQQMAATPLSSFPEVDAPAHLFRANEIRGVVGTNFSKELAYALGLAIGSEMEAQGEGSVIVARDGRLSSGTLADSLVKGLLDSGRKIINLGQTPTPILYFASHALEIPSNIMVTGGHNRPEFNGLKICIGGETLAGPAIQALRQRVEQRDYVSGTGKLDNFDMAPEYIERVVSDTQLGRTLKVVIDSGNGLAGLVAPELIRSLGCEVIEMYSDVDGHFPGHDPDPSNPSNLEALIEMVLKTKADIGLAFDADGDSMGLVDSKGKIIWPDRQMMLFAADVLSREPGADILFDVKCSRHLPSQIVKNGGRPLMWKSGHGAIKAKMKESGAILAGEFSGHIYFLERWYGFDDGIYAAARMIEILSNHNEATADVFARLPDSVNTAELVVALEEGESQKVMELIRQKADFHDARLTEIDGLRVDFLDGWGLVRAANTQPALSFRFEADSEKSLVHIQQQFIDLLHQIEPAIILPF